MKRSTFLILFILNLAALSAQDLKNNSITLQWGVGKVDRQDLIFSPFVHSDFSVSNIGIQYKREKSYFQKARLGFSGFSPMLTQPYSFMDHGKEETAYPHSFIFVDLDYAFGKSFSNSEKIKYIIAGTFNSDIQSTSYSYGRIGSFGYYSSLALGIYGAVSKVINEHQNITAGLQLPLLFWLARSPYLVNDDQFIENISSHNGLKTFFAFIGDGHMASWHKAQFMEFHIDYNYAIGKRWDIGGSYRFAFVHSGKPRNLLSYQNNLFVSTSYNF